MKMNNKVQLIGNLGMNPEVKEVGDKKTLAKFSIATNDYYKDSQGEKVEETHWHNVVAWGKTAEIAQNHLKKGTQAAIEGKLITRRYEDKDGNMKYVTEVLANEIMKIK